MIAATTEFQTVIELLGAALAAAVFAVVRKIQKETTIVNGHRDEQGRPLREPGLPAIYAKLEVIHEKVVRVDQRITEHIDSHQREDIVEVMSKPRAKRVKTGG